MAPMTLLFSPSGVPGANVADYDARRAEEEVGLMTEQDIAETIRAFAQAAAEAKTLGCDAVEIHGGRMAI